jgi:hypothetical protein
MARQAIMAPPIAAAITTRIEDTIGVVWAWQSLSQTRFALYGSADRDGATAGF